MSYTISIIIYVAIVSLLSVTISAIPHDLMVNNEFVRDVGVAYPDNNFTGNPFYLVTHKKAPKCETTVSGTALGSAQICVPATCILYKASLLVPFGHEPD